VSKRSGFYPSTGVDAAGRSTVSQAGAVVEVVPGLVEVEVAVPA